MIASHCKIAQDLEAIANILKCSSNTEGHDEHGRDEHRDDLKVSFRPTRRQICLKEVSRLWAPRKDIL